MENSVKPIFFAAAGREDSAVIHEMAAAMASSRGRIPRQTFSHQLLRANPAADPLIQHAVQAALLHGYRGFPVCYTPATMLGADAPVTVAAGLVQTDAEALGGSLIHQLKARGAPIISGVALPPLEHEDLVCLLRGPPAAGWPTQPSPTCTTSMISPCGRAPATMRMR